ncbi:DUF1624 domain-containing protein [Larkinella rosea]|uniref:DUF1624 domain-containing protein n=1 Tax=Larkinella rosea TaxID=2025312 RepID=A0A3P1C1Z8_9BACT|nr:heparan-alpha-glucosaminide N-acetyltransferase domain-containing protein [Larkinella rosea]RRB07312.1 DUF1624 domain-containing protein [Larkinella rosea]
MNIPLKSASPAITPSHHRIESMDVLRGLVMVIMALDHVRHLFHSTAFTDNPLELTTTTPALFLTRWITHFCAPVFIFLSGTSIYLQSLRKTKRELSNFLIKRGLWLVVAEVTIVTLGITFNPFYGVFILQVIWAIGISMIMLGLLIYLPFRLILALGLAMVLGHNALDVAESAPGFQPGFWWAVLHFPVRYSLTIGHQLIYDYPFMPWLGLMIVGYCVGIWFESSVSPARRRAVLVRAGLGLIVFFLLLRLTNAYGDPHPWRLQPSALLTLLSFLNVEKYPPSLLYMGMTIGPALLFLAGMEPIHNRFTRIMRTFGRTAFFYYLVHWYLIHTLCLIVFFGRGHTWADTWNVPKATRFIIPGEGFSLPVVYLIWALVILAMYPLCRWYDAYKTSHKNRWWLRYL